MVGHPPSLRIPCRPHSERGCRALSSDKCSLGQGQTANLVEIADCVCVAGWKHKSIINKLATRRARRSDRWASMPRSPANVHYMVRLTPSKLPHRLGFGSPSRLRCRCRSSNHVWEQRRCDWPGRWAIGASPDRWETFPRLFSLPPPAVADNMTGTASCSSHSSSLGASCWCGPLLLWISRLAFILDGGLSAVTRSTRHASLFRRLQCPVIFSTRRQPPREAYAGYAPKFGRRLVLLSTARNRCSEARRYLLHESEESKPRSKTWDTCGPSGRVTMASVMKAPNKPQGPNILIPAPCRSRRREHE